MIRCGLFKYSLAIMQAHRQQFIRILLANNLDPFEVMESDPEELDRMLVTYIPHALKDIPNPSEELCLLALKHCSSVYKYIPNPSEEFIWEALRSSIWIFPYIDNPTEEMIDYAIDKYPHNIDFIPKEKQTEERLLRVLKVSGGWLRNIDDPTEEMKEVAFENSSSVISVIEQTDERCVSAIERNPNTIAMIHDQNKYAEILLRKDPSAFCYLKEPTPEIIELAISLDPLNILYLHHPDLELADSLLDTHGELIHVFNRPTEEQCWRAIKCDPDNIAYIYNPTDEMIWHDMDAFVRSISDSMDFNTRIFSTEIACEVIKRSRSLTVLHMMLEPSEEVYLTAIEYCPEFALNYIPNPTVEMYVAAIKGSPQALKHVPSDVQLDEEVILSALSRDGLAIDYLLEPSPLQCFVAIMQNPKAYWLIDNPLPEYKLLAEGHEIDHPDYRLARLVQ